LTFVDQQHHSNLFETPGELLANYAWDLALDPAQSPYVRGVEGAVLAQIFLGAVVQAAVAVAVAAEASAVTVEKEVSLDEYSAPLPSGLVYSEQI
jgi:hypothetical protein